VIMFPRCLSSVPRQHLRDEAPDSAASIFSCPASIASLKPPRRCLDHHGVVQFVEHSIRRGCRYGSGRVGRGVQRYRYVCEDVFFSCPRHRPGWKERPHILQSPPALRGAEKEANHGAVPDAKHVHDPATAGILSPTAAPWKSGMSSHRKGSLCDRDAVPFLFCYFKCGRINGLPPSAGTPGLLWKRRRRSRLLPRPVLSSTLPR
jgi:hypothetical protein